jgi:hypothetical protein
MCSHCAPAGFYEFRSSHQELFWDVEACDPAEGHKFSISRAASPNEPKYTPGILMKADRLD